MRSLEFEFHTHSSNNVQASIQALTTAMGPGTPNYNAITFSQAISAVVSTQTTAPPSQSSQNLEAQRLASLNKSISSLRFPKKPSESTFEPSDFKELHKLVQSFITDQSIDYESTIPPGLTLFTTIRSSISNLDDTSFQAFLTKEPKVKTYNMLVSYLQGKIQQRAPNLVTGWQVVYNHPSEPVLKKEQVNQFVYSTVALAHANGVTIEEKASQQALCALLMNRAVHGKFINESEAPRVNKLVSEAIDKGEEQVFDLIAKELQTYFRAPTVDLTQSYLSLPSTSPTAATSSTRSGPVFKKFRGQQRVYKRRLKESKCKYGSNCRYGDKCSFSHVMDSNVTPKKCDDSGCNRPKQGASKRFKQESMNQNQLPFLVSNQSSNNIIIHLIY